MTALTRQVEPLASVVQGRDPISAPDRLAAVCMIRNEADILPIFLAHLRAVFDRALLIDHHSTDGTREILEAAVVHWSGLHLFDYDVQGYFQAALASAFARRAFAEGADWVFFLDADELVHVPDRAALLARLMTVSSTTPACAFAWRNLAPSVLGTFEGFDIRQEFLSNDTASRYVKVALSRRILHDAPGFTLELGNHAVLRAPGARPVEAPVVGEFLHIPIRSRDRLAMKVEAGAAAYEAKSSGRNGLEGFHWLELLDCLRRGSGEDDFLRNVALNYGEPLATIPREEAPRATHRVHIAPAGLSNGLLGLPASKQAFIRSRPETERRDKAVQWRRFRSDAEDNVLVVIDDNNRVELRPRVMRPSGAPGPECFARLMVTPDAESLADELSSQRIAAALDMAAGPIETLVPSSWSRLVPVMFGLIALLRPRRFVELGSHFGLSFFAACQAMRQLDELDGDAVAIDTWKGDSQAGYYTEDVFSNFIHLLRTRYPQSTFYIRSRFEEAVVCFEDGSIDLLHIDGLHTYDAVRSDFETWLPKMSERGVIIMHDTAVYERNYGVWQFWQTVAERYPSWNLLHEHGLGIVYVGTKEHPFGEALRKIRGNPSVTAVLNTLMRNLGDLSLAAATAAQDGQAAANARAAVEAELAAARSRSAELAAAQNSLEVELASIEGELASIRAQLASIYSSTSWRISAPVRVLGRMLRAPA